MLPILSMITIRSSGSKIEYRVSPIRLLAILKLAILRLVTNLYNNNILTLNRVKPNKDSIRLLFIDILLLYLSASTAANIIIETMEDLTTITTPTSSYAPI